MKYRLSQLLILVSVSILGWNANLMADELMNSSTILKGKCSWYGEPFHGRQTASGEIFNMNDMTGAHKTLPFNTLVKITLLSNQKSVIIRINDRGPFAENRIFDISKAAAQKIGLISIGVGEIQAEILSLGEGNSNANTSIPGRGSENDFVEQQNSGPANVESSSAQALTNIPMFKIQFGSYSMIDNARVLAKKLVGMNIPVKIYRYRQLDKVLYRVLSEESFQSRSNIETQVIQFQASGIPCAVMVFQE